MTEQPPPSADDDLRAWLRDSIMLHRSRPYAQDFVNEAMAHINEYAERVCEQRVSAETERLWARIEAEASALPCADHYSAEVARTILRRAIRAPAERHDPEPPICDACGKDASQRSLITEHGIFCSDECWRSKIPAERPAPPQHAECEHHWVGYNQGLGPKMQCVICWVERAAPDLVGDPRKCVGVAQDSPRRIGVEQPTQETDRPVGGPEGRADEPLDYIGTEPPPVGYVRLGWACPRAEALRCLGCDQDDVTPDMCGYGHPAYRSQKWIAWAGRPLPFPSALASTGEQPQDWRPILSLLNNLSGIWHWHGYESRLREAIGNTNYTVIADLIKQIDELPALPSTGEQPDKEDER